VLRRIFGYSRKEMAGVCSRPYNEKFHNLYASQKIIRVIKSRKARLAEHVECMGNENCLKILVGKLEGKRTLGRHKRRWYETIRIDLRETG
jgi:hypothetical protein